MLGKIDNSEDVDQARDRVRADRLIDSIDKAFRPARLAKLRKQPAPWTEMQTEIEGVAVIVRYDVDVDESGRRGVILLRLSLLANEAVELCTDDDKALSERIERECLEHWKGLR